jgi:membrane protease YdiL (CAAX protease family)
MLIDNRSNLPDTDILFPPFAGLFLVIGMVMVGAFIGKLIGDAGLLAVGFSLDDIQRMTQTPETVPNARWALLFEQATTALCAFVFLPILYIKAIHRKTLDTLNFRSLPQTPQIIGLAVLLTIVVMPFNSMFIAWNESLQLPDFMHETEVWIRTQEDTIQKLTMFFIKFDPNNWLQFVAVIVVVAVIPGIGEELLFRGVVQNLAWRQSQNHHVAIWTAAILFSLFHFQFYGFLPRMLLGALFGYLYWWSGNLYVPMFAHFVNNAFTVVLSAMQQQGLIGVDMEKPEQVPMLAVLSSGIVSGLLIWQIYKKCRTSEDIQTT